MYTAMQVPTMVQVMDAVSLKMDFLSTSKVYVFICSS